jgi:hypothetical protein
MARHLDLLPETAEPDGTTIALVPFGKEFN